MTDQLCRKKVYIQWTDKSSILGVTFAGVKGLYKVVAMMKHKALRRCGYGDLR